MDELIDLVILGALHAQHPKGKALGWELSDYYLDDDELAAARTSIRDTLAAEVSPGVTLGDAVRAYLALERHAATHACGPTFWNSLNGWHCVSSDGSSVARTLAAAILAAVEVPGV